MGKGSQKGKTRGGDRYNPDAKRRGGNRKGQGDQVMVNHGRGGFFEKGCGARKWRGVMRISMAQVLYGKG